MRRARRWAGARRELGAGPLLCFSSALRPTKPVFSPVFSRTLALLAGRAGAFWLQTVRLARWAAAGRARRGARGAQKERARGQMASHPTEHSKSVCILFSPGLNLRGATHLVCRGRCSTLCQQEARALLICSRAEGRRKKLVSEAVRPKSTLKLAQQFSKGQTLHLRRRAASEQWR